LAWTAEPGYSLLPRLLPAGVRASRPEQAADVWLRSERWPEKIGEGIEAIEQAPFLTEEQQRDSLYHNAVRFLSLQQQPV
jgi:hypothetical protein